MFGLYCFSFSFNFEKSQTTQNIANGKYFLQEKWIIQLTFNLELALTGFRTTRPWALKCSSLGGELF